MIGLKKMAEIPLLRMIIITLFVFCCFWGNGQKQQLQAASPFQNAEAFYDIYGADNMVFQPTTTDDGYIYFCTRGKTAATSAGIKFRTVGWQFCFKNTRTGEQGYVYYKRDGRYIRQEGESVSSSDGYTYNLYYIELNGQQGLLKRLNSSWLLAFTEGEVELTVNACMTLVVNGVVHGVIDDEGNITGKVYKTYEGIVRAASWSSGSKSSLKTYFNKTINGLFHKITIKNGSGISSTSGSGTYLYGSKVLLESNIASGYQWDANRGSKWTGNDGFSSKSKNAYYIVGDHDAVLTVNASGKQVKVIFHKNDGSDETYSEIYTYDAGMQTFGMKLSSDAAGWVYWNTELEGYHLPSGWAENPAGTGAVYGLNSSVPYWWINENSPSIDLYMVRIPKKVKVIFHKNDGSNETYSETYTYSVGGQTFGMKLSESDAYFQNWKRNGYSGITGWAETAGALKPIYNTCSGVTRSWIAQKSPEIHLYAVWGSTIQITVNPNGGSWKGSNEIQQYTRQNGELLSLPYPTREGYTFSGWTWHGSTGNHTRSSINGWTQSQQTQTGSNAVISYNSSECYTTYTWTVNSPVSSDAWNRLTAGTYSIMEGHTYRISGKVRVREESPVGIMVYHGGKENDYMNEKARYYAGSGWQEFSFDRTFDTAGTGYFEFVSTNFKGKSGILKVDIKNITVLDVTDGTYMVLDQIRSPIEYATNLAVTANWKGEDNVPYKVHHYLMNVSGSGYSLWETEEKTGTAGETLELSDLVKEKEGFQLPDKMTADGEYVTSTIIKGDGSTELFLYYRRKQYTLTLLKGSGIQATEQNGVNAGTVQIYYGAEVKISAEVKKGYEWNSESSWKGTFSSSRQNHTFLMPAEDVMLTAQASLINYKIFYDLDGGTVTGNPDTYTIEDSFTLNNPTREGKQFRGWTGSNGEIPQLTVKIEKGTIGNLQFYANWELEEYYLDVSALLNGIDYEDNFLESLYDSTREREIAAFDVWIKKPGEDWYQDAERVTDYCKHLPCGTQWKITNMETMKYEDMYYSYDGVKSGETGENDGSLEGTLETSYWIVPVFTSWHKLSVGGCCDGKVQKSSDGYGTFDINISGKNALGKSISEMESCLTGNGTAGEDVTSWEGYYPYGSTFTISDIRKYSKNIENGKYAEITYEGIYDFDGELLGNLVTDKNSYSSTLSKNRLFLLQFTAWYKTLLDQQGATTPGMKEVWHTICKQAYYKEAGSDNDLGKITIPYRFGYVFGGYFTEKNGKGTSYIDRNGEFINNLWSEGENQTLFAYWTSEPPEIYATNSYFTLEEAQSGKITEQELLKMAEARDKEEGILQAGNHQGTIFCVEDYDEKVFLELKHGAKVPITYVAIDQAGNICREAAVVFVVDTSSQILTTSGNQVRFISEEYLESQNYQGGLRKDSLWKRAEFYEILSECVKSS